MSLFYMLSRATESAAGVTSTRSGVVPLPAPVALYNLCLSRQGLSIGDNAKQAELSRKIWLSVLWEVDKPARGYSAGVGSTSSSLTDGDGREACSFGDF